MGKRGPPSHFKTKRDCHKAKKDSQKRWYQNNTEIHILNVTRRRQAQQLSHPRRQYIKRKVAAEPASPDTTEPTEVDPYEYAVSELDAIEVLYKGAIGMNSLRSTGENWLGQLKYASSPEDMDTLLARAQHLFKSAEDLTSRVRKVIPFILNDAIDLLDRADKAERRCVECLYIFEEVIQLLQANPDAYIRASEQGLLFWQGDS
ncbi:hypothetical protein M422DRAFT_274625 [Sphaerobolus stellatus SS14]|uniref:Uncharacterized protein n=1 Tax=Sphaerobolus stellatus (strain SS14) TaxID=990650 RepID=A0A0C9T6K2_SPHS4|nr:hypothetical protein M422DRAFT_274625 [Sphaerobolus stellatus SS14]